MSEVLKRRAGPARPKFPRRIVEEKAYRSSLNGLSVSRIASDNFVTVGTVRRWISRAREWQDYERAVSAGEARL